MGSGTELQVIRVNHRRSPHQVSKLQVLKLFANNFHRYHSDLQKQKEVEKNEQKAQLRRSRESVAKLRRAPILVLRNERHFHTFTLRSGIYTQNERQRK